MMKIMQRRLRNDNGEVCDGPLLWLADLIRRWTNLAIKHGAFPDVWKSSTLIPIPKVQDSIKINEQRPLCYYDGGYPKCCYWFLVSSLRGEVAGDWGNTW